MSKERTTGFYFKMSPEERALIEKKMALAGVINMSAYIRKMSIDGYILRLDIPELKEISKLLRVTSNNANQIAKRVNSGGGVYREDVAEVNGQLEKIWEQFRQVMLSLAKLK